MAREIGIREAGEGDAATLASLCATVHDVHVGQRPDVFKPTDLGTFERWFVQTVKSGSAKIWIAEIGGAAVGYALVMPQRRGENAFCHERRWVEVDQIAVRPEHRRHGVARSLLDHVAETARADGISDVELSTWRFNDGARTAFERSGFVPKMLRLERRAKPT